MKFRIGISTCPNDIYTFCGILNKSVQIPGVELELVLLDVQELNDCLAARSLDCSKASIHAALHLSDDYGLLAAGSAIGKGVGPLVLSRRPSPPLDASARVSCPGVWTTATLLFRLWAPQVTQISHCIFSDIMPRLQRNETDFGVVIHEGRFTYEQQGFESVCDLGEWWEQKSDSLLPLGGILARRNLGDERHRSLVKAIRESLQYARENPTVAFEMMQQYAQELEPDVIWSHVKLYVNEFTVDAHGQGMASIERLNQMAIEAGILTPGTHPVKILG